MEEEGARRRAYNGRGGAGRRGFLTGLNEDDEEDDDADDEVEDTRRKHGDAAGRAVQGQARGVEDRDRGMYEGGRAGQRDRGKRGQAVVGGGGRGGGRGGFELDMDGATLLGRRHKRGGMDPSPLAGKPIVRQESDEVPPGSPMRIVV